MSELNSHSVWPVKDKQSAIVTVQRIGHTRLLPADKQTRLFTDEERLLPAQGPLEFSLIYGSAGRLANSSLQINLYCNNDS